jgi:hypothetical protein
MKMERREGGKGYLCVIVAWRGLAVHLIGNVSTCVTYLYWYVLL